MILHYMYRAQAPGIGKVFKHNIFFLIKVKEN